ncbi:yhhN-like family protein [Mycobacterium xenopi 4042]|uniref:YhhN-like family protein n=1 Tax=Mycobacterium xenopi 4042 TaxID=1299334 RepID=X7YPJ5_MYCXE|nr:yhhN-like family protein [Mycobacterium xenopi 4042]
MLSAVGDWLLAIPWWAPSFVSGLASFLLAHLCFLAALLPLARWSAARLVAVVATCLACAALLAWFWPRLHTLAVPVTAYIVVLAVMVCAAQLARLPTVWTAVGAVCFAVSDAMIGIERFVLDNEALAVPVWWAYALAQILITAGSSSVGRSRRPSGERDPPGRRARADRAGAADVVGAASGPRVRLSRCRRAIRRRPAGVRVRIRFHGRLVDGFVLERRTDTDHTGKLGWLDRVISAEPVLTPEIRRLVDAVAARYAGTRPTCCGWPCRRAMPARSGKTPPRSAGPSWSRSTRRLGGLRPWRPVSGRAGRITRSPGRMAGAAGRAVGAPIRRSGRADGPRRARCAGDRPRSAGRRRAVAGGDHTYRRLRGGGVVGRAGARCPLPSLAGGVAGRARLVIGTRSAVFAPVTDLGLVLVWDDGDDTLAEPRAPYPHAREVALLRAHQHRCAALLGGYARTAEAHALVRRGWAHDIVAARPVVRACAPRVVAIDDHGYAEERDPAARTARLPSVALRAARSALGSGARCSCRCRAGDTSRRWPADAAAPSPAAGIAPVLCRCPTALRPARCAAGVAGSSPRCDAPAADPMRCVRWWSAPGARPRSWAGHFPARL